MTNSEKIKTVRYIFDRWEDTPMRKECHGLFNEFEILIRDLPECPDIFGYILTIWKVDGGMDSFENGTAPGSVFEVTFYEDHVTPEQIEKFFEDYKLHFHRAEPFLKP